MNHDNLVSIPILKLNNLKEDPGSERAYVNVLARDSNQIIGISISIPTIKSRGSMIKVLGFLISQLRVHKKAYRITIEQQRLWVKRI